MFANLFKKPSLRDKVKSWSYWLQDVDTDVISKNTDDLMVIDSHNDSGELYKPADLLYMKKQSKLMVAYISLGEAESYRSYWNKSWNRKRPVWLGPENKEWKGNYSIKQFWHPDWWTITTEILDGVIESGFDGIYIDKIDVYSDLGGTDELKEKMIQYIIKVSEYCKSKKSDFIIIAQNAEELAENSDYLNAVDGIGKESLFYSGVLGEKQNLNDADDINYSADCLNLFKNADKLVLCVEYVDPKIWPRIKAKYPALGYVGYCGPKLLDKLNLLA